MNTAWTRTVDPTLRAIDVATAKLHCRVSGSAEDAWFVDRIGAATDTAEEYLHFGVLTQTWKFVQDRFSNIIYLPMAGLLQGTPVVKYYDGGGVLQTVDPSIYLVDAVSQPARLVIAPGFVWPVVQPRRAGAVEITYVVGWDDPSKIVSAIVSGMLLLIGHWYVNRSVVLAGASAAATVLPFGLEALWSPKRIWWREPHDWMEDGGQPC